jgi:hypothetical protein
MGYWLKSYTDILDDPKYHRMPERAQLAMHEIFLVAKMIETDELTGLVPCVEDIAFYSRKSIEYWNEVIPELLKSKIINKNGDGYLIVNYVKRQQAIPPTIRAKKSKEANLFKIKSSQKPENSIFDLPESSGIYKITCTNSGRFYIGASKNILHRVNVHLSNMKRASSHPLYEDFHSSKMDYSDVKVEVLCECDDEIELGKMESKYIDEYKNLPEFANKENYGKNHHSWNESATNRWGDTDREQIENRESTDSAKTPDPSYEDCTPDGEPIQEKKKKKPKDERSMSPAIVSFRRLTGLYPPKVNYEQVISVLGDNPDELKMKRCYQDWCARGFKPTNINWLLDWYVNGVPIRGKPSGTLIGADAVKAELIRLDQEAKNG